MARYTKEGQIIDLHPNHAVARALGLREGKHDGVIVHGCGMNMGFWLVDALGTALGLSLKYRGL